MNKMKAKNFIAVIASTAALAWLPVNAEAATTGLDFAGGCPESSNGVTVLCGGQGGSNADVDNVAAILGVNASLVTQVAEVTGSDATVNGLTISGIGFLDGTWSISDPSITHIAFKSDGYFILGEVNASSGGTWDNADWDFTLATCPDTICTPGPRAYTAADFTTNGGPIAELSNARAFSVVPVPAAVWLFGSGLLGLVGVARRKRA
jgi:hypothetical protein